jgi:hypothetical protein
MSRTLVAATLSLALAASSGCAHAQLTNRELAIGAVAVTVVSLIVYLAVIQCRKGPTYCDNAPAGP